HRAFAHHEAVGAFCVGARAGGGEGADLAELHKASGAHVAVDTAGDGDVEILLDEGFGRGVDGRHSRGAGGVAGEVGAVEVEQVGDAAGDAVGELAGHGVFGDLRK